MKRFNMDADSQEEILNYIRNRSLQLAVDGIILKSTHWDCGCLVAKFDAEIFNKHNGQLHAIYIPKSLRNLGLYKKIHADLKAKHEVPINVEENHDECYYKELLNKKVKIVTTHDCELDDFLRKNDIYHNAFCDFQNWDEYQAISTYYGDEKAKRSQRYLMDHIDKGLIILRDIIPLDNMTRFCTERELAQKAFCLHPLVQSDQSLQKEFINPFGIFNSNIMTKSLALAMEYRSVANEYLSTRKIMNIEEIRLSPIDLVNKMLIADKIQNYTDFLKYHKDSHERSCELDQYFKNWFDRLQCWETFRKFENLADL